ncbi:GIY-YIG nuclease family protein [Akkermansiaceae bacterium]|nr:GIY-YIG nuclease family protein [Akkermansiaceae bacterium]MDA7888898.1 GIY-YIG nuclease family protein [Akkermansiaceae bacterium]
MFYTYILCSIENPNRHYIGFSSDLKQRLSEHNSGKCSHTAKYAPWKLHCYFAFENEATAKSFEAYLKTGSGREFSRRHFE